VGGTEGRRGQEEPTEEAEVPSRWCQPGRHDDPRGKWAAATLLRNLRWATIGTQFNWNAQVRAAAAAVGTRSLGRQEQLNMPRCELGLKAGGGAGNTLAVQNYHDLEGRRVPDELETLAAELALEAAPHGGFRAEAAIVNYYGENVRAPSRLAGHSNPPWTS
jgi:hypothetical protein